MAVRVFELSVLAGVHMEDNQDPKASLAWQRTRAEAAAGLPSNGTDQLDVAVAGFPERAMLRGV